jgi:membrane associated rhomboid family serine protease
VAVAKRGAISDFNAVASWLSLLWLTLIVDLSLRYFLGFQIVEYTGVWPLEQRGLAGVVLAHFFHANLEHLLANSIGLLLLGWMSCRYSRKLTAFAVLYAAIMAGFLAWMLGNPGDCHIGASGVIFGLIGFLLLNGLLRKGCLPLVIAFITFVLFGLALPGVLPDQPGQKQVSWQMHLGGFIGGLFASWQLRTEKA